MPTPNDNNRLFIQLGAFAITIASIILGAGKILGDVQSMQANGCGECQNLKIELSAMKSDDTAFRSQLARIETKVDNIDNFLRNQ